MRPTHRQFHTINDIAKDSKTSLKTVRRWIKSGDLVAHKLGTQWRVSDADYELFLRDRRGVNLPGRGDL